MNSAMFNLLTRSFAILGILLLVGTFLRAKVPFFQRLYLPAAVIGGTIGMLIGPRALNIVPFFSDEYLTTWNTSVSFLCAIMATLIPMGSRLGRPGEKAAGKTLILNMKQLFITLIVLAAQIMIGFVVLAVFRNSFHLYPTFGLEMSTGYFSGHALAAIQGSTAFDMALPYAEDIQAMAVTCATVGLIGGMVIGITFINVMVRRGRTALLKKIEDVPKNMSVGVFIDPADQTKTVKNTTSNSCIESFTLHLGLVYLCISIGYVVMGKVKAAGIPILDQFGLWVYSMIAMLLIQVFILNKTKLHNLFDEATKSKITGVCSDFAIVAAIASIPVQVVLKYWLPLVVLCILGFVVTLGLNYMLFHLFFKDYLVERTVSSFGACCGVMLTGLMLLKICDPDYETPVMSLFASGVALSNSVAMALMIVTMTAMSNGVSLLILGGIYCAAIAGMFIVLVVMRRAESAAFEGERIEA